MNWEIVFWIILALLVLVTGAAIVVARRGQLPPGETRPELPGDDPGYSLARDVDHILGAGIPDGADRDELRELLARVILDPTGTRDALHHALHGAVTLIPAP